MRVTGTIRYIQLEGGFWGIEGDDGMNYFPNDGIPLSLRSDQMRVVAELDMISGASISMWGKLVRIRSIEKLPKRTSTSSL